MRWFTLILSLAVSGFASTACAVDLHVDNVRGDDLRDGGSGRGVGLQSGPLRTIGRALQMAHAGDRIVLVKNDEPYRESLTLQGPRHCGRDRTPLILDGRGAILDGTCEIPPSAWRVVRNGVFTFEPAYRSTGLLFLDGMPVPRPASANPAQLKPGESTLERGVAWFQLDGGILPSSLNVRWTTGLTGITLYDVQDVEIRDLYVQGFAIDGINVHNSARNVRMARVAVRGNGRSGLHVGGASRAVLEDSHASDNGRAQIHLEGSGHLRLKQCDIWHEGAPALLQDGGTVTGDVPTPTREARAGFVDRFDGLH